MRSPPTAVMAMAALMLLLVSLAAAAADMTASEREWKRIQELNERVLADWKAGHGKNIRSEEETRRVFAEWKAQHGKKYSSAREDENRYAFFKERLRKVDLHKAAFGPNSVFTINGPFSDRTDEEWRHLSQGMSRY